jgi:tight adherence protein B
MDLFYHHWLSYMLIFPALVVCEQVWKRQMWKKKEEIFRGQFSNLMQAICVALKAGYSVENALREAKVELERQYGSESRIVQELERMIRGLDVHQPIEQVMEEFTKGVYQEDVNQFVIVFLTAKKMGGDSVQLIQTSVERIREKIEVEREIETILAAKKLEFQVMCMVPIGMILYLRWTFPNLLTVLYGNLFGVLFMSVCFAVYLLAYHLGQKMIAIEV